MSSIYNSTFFDVSKGNSPILFTLSLPLVALAWALWALFWFVATLACLVGRKRALNILYKTKELM